MISVRVPATPHRLLNPNSPVSRKDRDKLDWPLPMKPAHIIKGVMRRNLRETTSLAAFSVAPSTPITGKVVLHFTVAYEKGRLKLDWDNCCAMLKGAIDGIVDAGFIKDDNQVKGIFIEQVKDPDGFGYTDISVEEI